MTVVREVVRRSLNRAPFSLDVKQITASLARFLTRHRGVIVIAFIGIGTIFHFIPGKPVLTIDGFFHLQNTFNCSQDIRPWSVLTSPGNTNSNLSLLPVDCTLSILQSTHLPLWITEALFEVLLGCAAAAGMYGLVGRFGQLLRYRVRWAPAIAAIFWVANPFALSYIWYHVLYVQVLWAALPWLCLCVASTEVEWGLARASLIAFAVTVVGSAGLAEAELPQVVIVLLFIAVAIGLMRGLRAFLHSLVIIVTAMMALLWWLLPSLSNLRSLYSTAAHGANTSATLDFASGYSTIWHLLTLVAVPQLYQTVGGVRYIAWSALATSSWGKLALCGIPVLSALGAYSLLRQRSRLRGIAPLFVLLFIGLLICKGKASPLPASGTFFSGLPGGAIFRQPVNNFGLWVIVPITLFVSFGCEYAFAYLTRLRVRRVTRVSESLLSIALLSTIAVVVAPWWSGWVYAVGGGVFPSATYSLPTDYDKVGALLADAPIGGKTLVLPYSLDGESAFEWPNGLQPNSDPLFEGWQQQRTVLANPNGRPGDPGLQVAQCIAKDHSGCLQMAAGFGIDTIVVHKDWDFAYMGLNIARPSPEATEAYFFSQPSLTRLIPRVNERIAFPASGSLSLWIDTSRLPSTQDRFLALDGLTVQINAQDFFALYAASRGIWDPGIPLGSKSGSAFLTLTWKTHELRLWINGSQQGSPVYVPGPMPREVQVLAPGSAPGTTRAASGVSTLSRPTGSCGVVPCTTRGGGHVLYSGQYLELLSLRKARPLLNSSSCTYPDSSRLSMLPPLLYGGSFKIRRSGCSLVIFRESFNTNWRLVPTSPGAEVVQHIVAPGHYNEWIIHGSADSSYSLDYSNQGKFILACFLGALVGIIYLLGVMLFIFRHRSASGDTARSPEAENGPHDRTIGS